MTEDQFYPSHLDPRTSNSTVNNDFNKYDPYVEKIRTLFVPSLESRIYSCLETFVYREDHEALLEPPYLKRCLDVVATWREPVYAISTKLGEPKFLETMLAQTVKYLIKDGLIDCFLDSIILNNRLNKVCRNLDAANVEKNFLRYLTVWNYINEKDYWIENDSAASTSVLMTSFDSIETSSDLDVQVGSGRDTERTKGHYSRLSKRPVVDSSEFVCNNVNDSAENCCSLQFCSRLNKDSKNLDGSKSSWIKKKPRSISQTYPCRPSNCPGYRTKKSQQPDWEGKTLKIRVCQIPSNCPKNVDDGDVKTWRLSRLSLPCKFDDMIADIFKADQSVSRLSSITMSKKLRASVIDICRCINETLGIMSSEEVKRCRFHCEILPGLVTFKLVQRQSNGSKACLFSDRIATDRIDGQFMSRGTPFSQKFENIEEENTDKSDLPIFESTRIDLNDKDSTPVAKIETESQVTNSLRLPKRKSDATDNQQSNQCLENERTNQLSRNHLNDQSCGCSYAFLNGFENSDREEEGNTGTNRVEGSEMTVDRNNSEESLEKVALNQSSGNAIEDGSCSCNNSDNNKPEIFESGTEKTQNTDCVDSIEVAKSKNLGEKTTPENSFNHLSGNEAEDQTCHCSEYFPFTFTVEADSEKNQASNCVECLDKRVKDFETPICKEFCQDDCATIPDYQKMSIKNIGETSPSIDSVENDQTFITSQLPFSNSPPEIKSQNGVDEEIRLDEIRSCECPASCECINKRSEVEQCDSQYSCDTCELSKKPIPFNRGSNIDRNSALVNSELPSKMDSLPLSLAGPIPIKERQYSSADNVELQSNGLKSEGNSRDLHHPRYNQETFAKSKISLPSAVLETSISEAQVEETWRTRTSFKSVQTVTEKLPNFVIKETREKLLRSRSPDRRDTKRAFTSRSQRINISIELCSESQSSRDNSLKNQSTVMLPVCSNVQDLLSMWRPRCHSADAPSSRKQAILKSEKNTKDECASHLRGVNACLHSPARPMESRDYLPPSQRSPRMRNPMVYGMSTKSEGQSTRQHKRRKNRLKYSKNTENRRCCNEFTRNERIRDEFSNQFSSATKKSINSSSSVIHNNLCHAFSASSVDRMKHLIKTKLRRILLERDKATNTPKTCLTNEKYRVSVPNGKTKRLPISRQRYHTIWESRSASASTHTSDTFGSNARNSAKIFEGNEIKTLFHSTTNSKIGSKDRKDFEARQDSDKTMCYCLRSSDQSVVSSHIIDQRLHGGSDAPCRKRIDREFQYLWKQPQKSRRKIMNSEIENVYNHCDDRLSLKSTNRTCNGNSVAGDASYKPLRLRNSADREEEVKLNERQDEIMKCPGKLDWSGNSTSRHIYLHEYNNSELSDDGKANKWCKYKIYSPKCNSLSITKQGRKKKDPRKSKKSHKSNGSQENCRSSRRKCPRDTKMPGNIRASSFVSSKIHATSNIKGEKAFGKLDQDLRSKLLQYVSLCKNVKYSLLKMLRPEEVYDVRGLSVPRANRYKFEDS